MNNGDGTFAETVSYELGSWIGGIATGDLNGDGASDLVVACHTFLAVLMNNGDGTYATPIEYFQYGWSEWVAVGDLDADGAPDVVTTDSNGRVGVFMNNGDGSLADPILQFICGPSASLYSVTIADVNDDAMLDAVLTTFGNCDDVWVMLNAGDGSLGPVVRYGAVPSLRSTAIADVNGDGVMDILTSSGSHDLALLLGRCDPPPLCPADVNGDLNVNVLDLLAVLAAWGATSGPEAINGDGIVNVLDLLEVLAGWGPC
jgi:hypothetical protein